MPVEDPQEHDPFADRFARALHQAGAGFETHRDLAAAGEARGRGLVLRRRAAVLAGAAAVACAGVGGALLLPGDGGTDDRRSVAAATAGPSPAAGEDGGITAREMIRTLRNLLPEGRISKERGVGTDREPLMPYAQVVHDDGAGGGAIAVSLQRVEPGSREAREATTCPDRTFVPYDACRTTELADGSLLMIFQGYEHTDRRTDTKWWAAELVTPEGRRVSVSEWNAEAQKDAPVTRPEPPLSVEELKELATAPVWRPMVDVLRERQRPGPDASPSPESSAPAEALPPAGAPDERMRKTFVSLLPDGLEVKKHGGEASDHAYLVVDDGEGASMVQVNVQADMSGAERQLFGADAETLPDGTKVVRRQGPGEKGGRDVVMWTVDTIRPDGMRVVISAFNSGAQHTAATREAPALTMGQLREIATSPEWRDLL
ncbi:hypothetical protein [Streptomyces sp. MJP52]|uniref:hypothetical protein n=1 Tax=Streptomyces sp. MJP52 TaxID=2940555 RepID=UPI0024762AAE|nr:hypothetical protein [Streptomyces sp. MJP52]MDH6223403.1 hypothetical protein [Streptomyces sp. MJP52]